MAALELVTDIDPQSCKQRLLAAGRPGYLAVGTDGTNDLAAWAPTSPGAPPSGVFCKIAIRGAADGSSITVSTGMSSLARTAFMCWSTMAGWLILRFALRPVIAEGHASFDRLLLPLGYVFSIVVMVAARLLDGRSVERRVLETLRRELEVRGTPAQPAP
jgi:hypothetical protein